MKFADLGAVAVIVVDVQCGFDLPRWGARNNPEAEENIVRIRAAARERGVAVYHVAHDSPGADGAFRPGTPGNAFKAEGVPLAGEPVYRKTVNSAFIGTTLERDLRAAGVTTVVIVGFSTPHCISTSTRMASNLGFRTIVVSDATAAFATAGIDGRLRPADEVHYAALSDVAGEFATVVDSAAVIAALRA